MEAQLIIQISDTHVFASDDGLFGEVNTDQSLGHVIDHILAQQPDVCAVIVTGDLVQEETAAAYQRFVEHIGRFDCPVYCLPGNHDDPELMTRCLDRTRALAAPEALIAGWRWIFLNTWQPGTHAGRLSDEEYQRLENFLKSDQSLPVAIALHHHPVSIDSTWMDGMALENPERLLHLIDDQPRIKLVVWGHIHQEFRTGRADAQLLGCPSTCAQFLPGATAYARDEAGPGYRRLFLAQDGLLATDIVRLD